MPNYINSPNMNLPIPIVGVDPGPDYANNINAALTLIDSHDHTPGKGNQITPTAMNINANLSFANHALINLSYVNLNAQSAVTTLTSVYVKGNELFYRDGNNNEVQMTLNGGVNGTPGTITGLPSGTAGVSYNSGTYTFSEATNTPGNLQTGSVLLGNNTALSKYLTLSPPNAMASNFTLTLPTIPGALSIVQMDTSGNFLANLVVDNTTLQNSGTVLSVKNLGINTAQIANAAVGRAQLSAGVGLFVVQSFTSSTTVTVPTGVTAVYIRAVGGGGGGGGGAVSNGGTTNGGGAGGQAGSFEEGMMKVAPGDVLTITVGAAGGGGSGDNVAGGNGGNSTVSGSSVDNNRIIGLGGIGGTGAHFDIIAGTATGTAVNYNRTAVINFGGGNGGISGGQAVAAGVSTLIYSGGSAGVTTGGRGGGGGGGGASVYGVGGNGGNGDTNSSGNATAGQTPSAVGAGGGGGGGQAVVSAPGRAGGSGGSGQVSIFWVA